jgi:hypothetical protein
MQEKIVSLQATILWITFATITMTVSTGFLQLQLSWATTRELDRDVREIPPQSRTASSDGNVYIAWPSNETGIEELMFSVSNDGGVTFQDAINLSNTNGSASVDPEMSAEGDSVYVTWWEWDQSGQGQAVMRVSNDNGVTFGPVLNLAANGTIGSS